MLAEAFRVLKPGGRFAVSDVVFQGDMSLMPPSTPARHRGLVGCIAGALEEQDYLLGCGRAGFADAAIEVTNVYDGSAGELHVSTLSDARGHPGGQRLRPRHQAGRLSEGRGGVMERIIGIEHQGGWSRDER